MNRSPILEGFGCPPPLILWIKFSTVKCQNKLQKFRDVVDQTKISLYSPSQLLLAVSVDGGCKGECERHAQK